MSYNVTLTLHRFQRKEKRDIACHIHNRPSQIYKKYQINIIIFIESIKIYSKIEQVDTKEPLNARHAFIIKEQNIYVCYVYQG
jgi:hypothetical protein